MAKQAGLPALTGKELIKLFVDNGWSKGRIANHGVTLFKQFPEGKRVTFIPNKSCSLPKGTLMAILGHKQTKLGRNGLLKMLENRKRKKS